MMMIMIMWQYL